MGPIFHEEHAGVHAIPVDETFVDGIRRKGFLPFGEII